MYLASKGTQELLERWGKEKVERKGNELRRKERLRRARNEKQGERGITCLFWSAIDSTEVKKKRWRDVRIVVWEQLEHEVNRSH